MSDLYSDRCIEAAFRQRKFAHDMRDLARKIEATYPPPCSARHIGFDDANAALRDAIRWIHAAKIARLREHNAADMQAIRETANECRTAAE